MKKLVVFVSLFISILIFTNTAVAQFEYAGGGISLATGGKYKYEGLDYNNNSFGIDIRALYDYNKNLKLVPDLKFYLPKKYSYTANGESKTTVLAFNLNAHYILNSRARESYRLYLLAGAHVSAWNIKDDHIEIARTVDFNVYKFVPGANIGAGMQFPIGGAIFFAEAKYIIAKTNQLVFTPGILFEL